jgi:hypothetical protein
VGPRFGGTERQHYALCTLLGRLLKESKSLIHSFPFRFAAARVMWFRSLPGPVKGNMVAVPEGFARLPRFSA